MNKFQYLRNSVKYIFLLAIKKNKPTIINHKITIVLRSELFFFKQRFIIYLVEYLRDITKKYSFLKYLINGVKYRQVCIHA